MTLHIHQQPTHHPTHLTQRTHQPRQQHLIHPHTKRQRHPRQHPRHPPHRNTHLNPPHTPTHHIPTQPPHTQRTG
ncbi:hypothetical protein AB0J49_30085, partial [Streptomyces sp. NPDC049906]